MYLIPNPKKLNMQEGNFTICYNSKIFIDSFCHADIYHFALLLQKELRDCCGFFLPITRKHMPKEACSNHGFIYLTSQEAASKQSYDLFICESGVTVKGGGNSGLLYGVQTLRQIIRQFGAVLPALTIFDSPCVENRGFYYDTSRGRVPTLAYLKGLADDLSYYKINQLQLYIEHSYLFENLSEVWRDDTPLTAENILELDRYCRSLEIELVPSLSSFGHLYKILCTQSYQHLSELENAHQAPFSFFDRMRHHTIDCTNPESFELVKSMLSEYMQLFTSNKFNICADETFDLGKGKSREQVKSKGLTAVYADFLTKISSFIIENGKIPMFWSDVICEEPDFIHRLPKEMICLHWDYDPDLEERRLKNLVDAGAQKLYVCPGVHGWNHLVNVQHSAYENVSKMCMLGHKYHAMGILTTDWGDYGHINHPDFSRLGLIYGAAFSWSDQILPEDEMNRQISIIAYGDTSLTLASTFEKLSRWEAFPWMKAVQVMESLSHQNDSARAKSVLEDCDPSLADEYNHNIDQQISELYAVVGSLPAAAKDTVCAYMIAGEGQKLLNSLLPILTRQIAGRPGCGAANPKKLAEDLENWLFTYRALWKSVSKESEFYRIANVYYWYADFLRAL